MDGAVVGEMRRTPKRAWSDGPANSYAFLPNHYGKLIGLSMARGHTIQKTLAKAELKPPPGL